MGGAGGTEELTLAAQRDINVVDLAILAENLAQVIFRNVLGESFDDNLGKVSVVCRGAHQTRSSYEPLCSSTGSRCEIGCDRG